MATTCTSPKTISLAPETHLLQQVDWDYFCTLTHRPERAFTSEVKKGGNATEYKAGRWWLEIPKYRQQVRLRRYINKVQRRLRLPTGKFLWVSRLEKGSGGRDHFHVLVRLLQRNKINRGTVFQLRYLWEFGGAHVKKVSSTGLENYIAKVQRDYEESRFSTEPYRSVEFSTSFNEYLKKVQASSWGVIGAGENLLRA